MRRILTLLSCATLIGGDEPKAPRAHLTLHSSSRAQMGYVDVECDVDRDAYVLIIGVDLDRRVHVLFPENPGATAFIAREQVVNLPRFRGGAGNPGEGRYPTSGSYDPVALTEVRANNGAILVVASDAPLNIDDLQDGSGEWNGEKLRGIVLNGSAAAAAVAIGRRVTGPKQVFSADSRVNVFR
jgi:hypothetical protein